MFKKYEALSEAYETMTRLANESICKMLEAETAEEVIFHEAQHEAFMKAASAIHEQIMKELRQL